MKILKSYQEEAVSKLIDRTKSALIETGNETIIFQSPTGSGKTFMATKFIERLVDEVDDDLCFVWVSIGKGGLEKQSYKSVKREISTLLTCSLMEQEFFGSREFIKEKEVVFLNWEKIRAKDKETGDWKNFAMKDKETNRFIEVLENTRISNRKIILIIDESHASAASERAIELRDEVIKPEITIEMSATPILLNNYDFIVKVNSNDVISQGMIKKEILINPDIENIMEDEMNSQELVLEAAIKKREELVKLYDEVCSEVNPLVLIQLPNKEAGDDKKLFSKLYLRERGITEENGKLAVWLSDEKINNDSDTLIPFKSKVEYLIFKQAIDTGWDCPRASILVKFRESQSIVFEIQTLGRILRMPEGFHYDNDILNTSYVYTNIKSIDVKKETYNPNIIKSLKSERREIYQDMRLRSYYKHRVNFDDITSAVYDVFDKVFCEFIGADKNKLIQDFYSNIENMKNKGIVMDDFDNMDKIIHDEKIDSAIIDKTKEVEIINKGININYAENDLQAIFEEMIRDNLQGFAPVRSIPTVKEAIYKTMNKYLNLKKIKNGVIYIQNVIVRNFTIFSQLINKVVDEYKPVHQQIVETKNPEKYNDEWEILKNRNYNPETTQQYKSNISLYQPLYIPKIDDKTNKLETDFIDYLDNHEDKISWFWQNGSEQMESNFGIKKPDGYTFQPDFIIKFKDGKIGIFDTKAINYNQEDTKIKAEALQQYINEERNKGKDIFGGIIVENKPHFMINQKEKYLPFNTSQSDWEYFENIL